MICRYIPQPNDPVAGPGTRRPQIDNLRFDDQDVARSHNIRPAEFVNAEAELAVAVLTDQDLAYLEEHPDLVTSPPRALARMRARMRGRYLDLTPTLRALTNGNGAAGSS